MAFYCNVYAADVVATWDHDGQNCDGYTLYWKKTTDADWQWNKSVAGSDTREMTVMPEEYFESDVEYTFTVVAHSNDYGDSEESNHATFTRVGGGFPFPADNLPVLQFTVPNLPSDLNI